MKTTRKGSKGGRPAKGELPKSMLGKKLKILQGDRKNSEIQEILGVSHTAYSSYLSGSRVPDARSLHALAAATRVDLNWLLDDDQPIPADGQPVLVPEPSEANTTPKGSDLLYAEVGLLMQEVAKAERLAMALGQGDKPVMGLKEMVRKFRGQIMKRNAEASTYGMPGSETGENA